MANINPEFPAFPTLNNASESGLSHRTYIATHILQGLLSTAPEGRDLAKQAVELADALVAELNAKPAPR